MEQTSGTLSQRDSQYPAKPSKAQLMRVDQIEPFAALCKQAAKLDRQPMHRRRELNPEWHAPNTGSK